MFIGKAPGAYIIKFITAVIYVFRIKLECLSLKTRLVASLSSLVKCLVTNTLAYYGNLTQETVNYGRNKFYDTGSWS